MQQAAILPAAISSSAAFACLRAGSRDGDHRSFGPMFSIGRDRLGQFEG